jgi:ubiquitin C-terminal hydrolase
MTYLREQIKEELLMDRLIMRFHKHDSSNQNMQAACDLIMCRFKNPPGKNLCFSNAVISCLLNIPVLKNCLLKTQSESAKKESEIFQELFKLTHIPKFSKVSTQRLRYLTKRRCIELGDFRKNFSDNKHHDAWEFCSSILSFIFRDSVEYAYFDEHLFGGVWKSIT